MTNVTMLKSVAQQFAGAHNLDAGAVELALAGVLERVQFAMAKGEAFSDELVQAAFAHWHKAQEQYYADLIENVNGVKDRLILEVYNGLSGAH